MIVIVFCIGYLCIALESVTRVNKAAVALLMCVGCWTLLMLAPGAYYPEVAGEGVGDVRGDDGHAGPFAKQKRE